MRSKNRAGETVCPHSRVRTIHSSACALKSTTDNFIRSCMSVFLRFGWRWNPIHPLVHIQFISDWCSSIINSNDVFNDVFNERQRESNWWREGDVVILGCCSSLQVCTLISSQAGWTLTYSSTWAHGRVEEGMLPHSHRAVPFLFIEYRWCLWTAIVYIKQQSMTMGHVSFLSLCRLSNRVDKENKVKMILPALPTEFNIYP